MPLSWSNASLRTINIFSSDCSPRHLRSELRLPQSLMQFRDFTLLELRVLVETSCLEETYHLHFQARHPDNAGSKFLRNIVTCLSNCTASQ
jgi:hypothetical protein